MPVLAASLGLELITRFGEYEEDLGIDKVPPRQLPFDVITPDGLFASGLPHQHSEAIQE